MAFALARELVDRYGRRSAHLVASGRHTPHRALRRPPLHPLPTAAFLDAVVAPGGTPPEIQARPDLLELSEPMPRADLTASECYRWDGRDRVRCPVTVVVATADTLPSPAEAQPWQVVTTGPFRALYVPGDHFHPRAPSAELLAGLDQALGSAVPAGEGVA